MAGRASNLEGNLLRPRPTRPLPDVLRNGGHGSNGFPDPFPPSAISRFDHLLLSLSLPSPFPYLP